MNQRDQSLDALRGLAILGMVFSGSIAFGGSLPGWMFHAQVPPPLHHFDPLRAGISWVDLVFPFFLFALGAAFPLALHKIDNTWSMMLLALRRFAVLLFFALFSHQMKAWVLSATPDWQAQTYSLAAFALLGLLLGRAQNYLKVLAWISAVAMLILIQWQSGSTFQFNKSDIILIVLANMALFGSLLWWFTRNSPLMRLGILPFLAAILLAGNAPDSWNAWLLNANPVPWAMKIYYLKYLFILVPGMFAGEWMLKHGDGDSVGHVPRWFAYMAAGLIVTNLCLLYERQLLLNLVISAILLVLMAWCLRRQKGNTPLTHCYFQAGAYLLLLGLAFEAFEGGIHKDKSTFSYYFVTSGLAFFALITLSTCGARIVNFLAIHGRNPMLAYVAGSLFLLPLLKLSGCYEAWNSLNANWAQAILKGLLFTGAVSLLTIWCTRRGWLWKS